MSWWLDSFSFIKELRRSIDGLQYTTIQTRIKPLKWLLSLQNGLIILYIIRNITSVHITCLQSLGYSELSCIMNYTKFDFIPSINHYNLHKTPKNTLQSRIFFFSWQKKTASTNHSFNMYNYDFFLRGLIVFNQKKSLACFICTKEMQVFFYFISFGVYFDVSIWIET